MSKKIFRDEKGREKLEEWYNLFLDRIEPPVESIQVETTFGPNHVLRAGDKDKPVIVCLHAMMTSSAHVVSEVNPLLKHYQIIAPDLPGQSVRGLETHLSYKDHSFAEWLNEITDELGLGKIRMLGVSLGGFAALEFARLYPENVQQLILVVPAGIVRGSTWKGIKKMAMPTILYQLNPTEERLKKVLDPILTVWDEDWAHYMGDAFRVFRPDLRIPPLISDEEFRNWTIPTLVFAAEDDISFPGRLMVKRLNAQNIEIKTELISACKHCPPTTPAFRNWLSDNIMEFFENDDQGTLKSDKSIDRV